MSSVVKQVIINEAVGPEEMVTVRRLFEEYAAELGHDLCFQGFADELATLPGSYVRPDGRLLLASAPDEAAGCVGLRRLDAKICEMKRLYVRPAYRGVGAGRMLAEAIIAEGRAAGYQRMRLDTLSTMVGALALYRRLGFRDIAPYRDNPIAGVVYLELELNRRPRET
jgi:putative acetyltransferase